jgi:hypothetical protein
MSTVTKKNSRGINSPRKHKKKLKKNCTNLKLFELNLEMDLLNFVEKVVTENDKFNNSQLQSTTLIVALIYIDIFMTKFKLTDTNIYR